MATTTMDEKAVELPAALDDLANEINHHHQEYEDAARSAIEHAGVAGELLIEAKAQVAHGGWLTWMADNIKCSERMAQNYMAIARRWPELESNTKRVADLPLRDGLRLLAEPAEPGGGAHVANNSGENEWYTPNKYPDAARSVMGKIDLDPASCAEANAVIQATKFFSLADGGLSKVWSGCVWMNPPYAQPLCRRFCERLAGLNVEGSVPQAVVLLNNATETAWFRALATVSTAVCFPQGRIQFWQPDKVNGTGPLQEQAFIYLGDRRERFREVFSEFGIVLEHIA